MTRRTYILFSILVGLLIFAGFFMGLWNFLWEEKEADYTLALQKCDLLSESNCLANPKCEPIYSNLENKLNFLDCKEIEINKKKLNNKSEELCQATSGKWQNTKLGPYCQCPFGKTWQTTEGCK
ncbi:hypothetical protein C4572_02440 [Candidatus Parcubacteria bacterium]|nr:MAG: hypothetical protein C4572_02440 [Candidatus Parcubacteria bacterium]